MSVNLGDIMDVLFTQVNKINDPAITGDQLKEQLERSRATVSISNTMINTARLALDAQKSLPDMFNGAKLPSALCIDKDQ